MKTSLYNQDGSLHPEAQFLLSFRSSNMSMKDWKKRTKAFRSQLSEEDLKEFERLKKNKISSEWQAAKRQAQRSIEPAMKVSLYEQDGSLHQEAQCLLSFKPDDMPIKEWRKRIREFKSVLSEEDFKKFARLKRSKIRARTRARNPEKARERDEKWHTENPEKSKAIQKNWRANNSEKVREDHAKWRADNPEKLRESNAKWEKNNSEKAKEGRARRRAENPEKERARSAKWAAENRDYLNNYRKQRRARDPLFHLHCNMVSMGNRVVRQLALGKKPAHTEKWQGCTAEELKAYLESLFTEGMTWENYGKDGWHVDHIRPVCSFSAEEWEQINHYANLRPLWAEDNIAKGREDKKQSVRNKSNSEKCEPEDQALTNVASTPRPSLEALPSVTS